MKKVIKVIFPLLIISIVGVVYYNLTNPTKINSFVASKIYKAPANSAFTDDNFYQCVIYSYNNQYHTSLAYTSNLSDSQLASIQRLSCPSTVTSGSITSTQGIEKLTGITWMSLSWNLAVDNFDISKNVNLTEMHVDFYYSNITSLDLSKNTKLKVVDISLYKNEVNSLDLSKNTNIENLKLNSIDYISELDLSKNTNLLYLDVDSNSLTEMDLSSNENLETAKINALDITELDFSNNPYLTKVDIWVNNIASLNLKNNPYLTKFNLKGASKITSIDLSKNNRLEELFIENAYKLNELKLYPNNLTDIYLTGTDGLENLDLTNATKLEKMTIQVGDDSFFGENEYTFYVGTKLDVNEYNFENDSIKVPSQFNNLPYYSTKIPYTTVVGDHIHTLDSLGKSVVTETFYDDESNTKNGNMYQINHKINVIGIKSTRYEIDHEKEYIYTGKNVFSLNNISYSGCEIEQDGNKLNVYVDGSLYKQYDIISLSQSYEIRDSYIYLGNKELNLNDIVNSPAIAEKDNLTLNVKIYDEIIDTYSFVGFTTTYLSGKDYLYVGTDILESGEYENSDRISVYSPDGTGYAKIVESNNKKFLRVYYSNYYWSYYIISNYSTTYDLTKGYIFVGNSDLQLSEIDVSIATKAVENNKLLIKYNDEVLNEFDIVSFSSDKYDLTNDYIYLVNEELDLSEINVVNATKVLEDNKLLIKYNEEIVKSFDIVNISSNKYDLSKGVVYVGPYDFDNTLINTTNATLEETEDLLTVKYNDIVLQEYPIIKFYSDAYEITDKYIIKRQSLGGAYFFKSNYQLRYISRDTFPVNYLVIEYNDKEIAQLINVSYDSSVYDMFDESKNYIYVGTGNLDLNKIIVSTGISKTVENNKLVISHEGTVFKEMDILSVDFGELIILDKKIVVPKETTYEDFLSNITANGVTPKIYNDKEEVTTGYITSSMNLQFYVGEELVDTYEIIDEYLEISDNLNVNETTGMIEDLTVGQTVENIKENIDTTGTVKVVDQENNEVTNTVGTGYKVVIELSKEAIEYTLVVSGDITGDGEIKMSDVMKAATQMIEENTIVGDCYLKAADVTGDGKIRMSDVMKLANLVLEGGNN